MLLYKKENGFPMTISFDTKESEDKKEGWKGFESIIRDENENQIAKIYHKTWHDRALWADGFFTALKIQKEMPELF